MLSGLFFVGIPSALAISIHSVPDDPQTPWHEDYRDANRKSKVDPDLWRGIGEVQRLDARGQVTATCTGTLIAPRAVLTAAHCFFSGSSGKGQQDTGPYQVSFFGVKRPVRMDHVVIDPGYDSTKGHREGGHDIAVMILTEEVSNLTIYRPNIDFESVERPIANEDLLNPDRRSVKLGFGNWGSGFSGAVLRGHELRLMENRIDAFGDGQEQWWYKTAPGKPIAPPDLTFVYDFDDPTSERALTTLRNEYMGESALSLAVGEKEGGLGGGDSGGPMFQFLDDGAPVLVGITSSSLASWYTGNRPPVVPGGYGDIFFDTNVGDYSGFLYGVLEAPMPSGLGLVVGGAALFLFLRLVRRIGRTNAAPSAPSPGDAGWLRAGDR